MYANWRTVAFALAITVVGPAQAAQHEIKMLNTGAAGAMVFEPALTRIQPGDSVKFVATHKGHNAQSIDLLRPEGGTRFLGKMNEEIVVTFDKPGIYAYECKPHNGLGMVGLVVVGDPSANLDAVRKASFRGKTKERFEALVKQIAP